MSQGTGLKRHTATLTNPISIPHKENESLTIQTPRHKHAVIIWRGLRTQWQKFDSGIDVSNIFAMAQTKR